MEMWIRFSILFPPRNRVDDPLTVCTHRWPQRRTSIFARECAQRRRVREYPEHGMSHRLCMHHLPWWSARRTCWLRCWRYWMLSYWQHTASVPERVEWRANIAWWWQQIRKWRSLENENIKWWILCIADGRNPADWTGSCLWHESPLENDKFDLYWFVHIYWVPIVLRRD